MVWAGRTPRPHNSFTISFIDFTIAILLYLRALLTFLPTRDMTPMGTDKETQTLSLYLTFFRIDSFYRSCIPATICHWNLITESLRTTSPYLYFYFHVSSLAVIWGARHTVCVFSSGKNHLSSIKHSFGSVSKHLTHIGTHCIVETLPLPMRCT